MKKILAFFLTLAFLSPSTALAFSITPEELPEGEEIELAAEEPIQIFMEAEMDVEVNKSIIFDASATASTLSSNLTYEWFLGDGNRQSGPEVVHSYATPGDYEVTLVVRDDLGNQATQTHQVFVYDYALALITNLKEEQVRIQSFVDTAKQGFVLVKLIETYESPSEFLAEQALKDAVSKNLSVFSTVDTLVVWTEDSAGLTALSQAEQSVGDSQFFKDKTILFISDQDFGSLSNIARGVFKTIEPAQIILTRSEAVWVTLEEFTSEGFISVLQERGIQYQIVDEKLRLKPWTILPYMVSSMIDRGVPLSTLQLVFMLPVIVTVVAFTKQVIGLSTLGVYTPSILALSFIALDIKYGLFFLISLLTIGILTKTLLKRFRMLYIPRMAIVLTIVSLTIFFLLYVGSYFNISQIVGIAVFPMLMMSTLVEKFISLQTEQGLKSAIYLTAEAIGVAIVCTFIAEWVFLKTLILGHPEVIFIFLLINIFLSQWTGLRLVEYVRFREIIRHSEEE
ncbi:MAG: PKD domain-containing protein [Patescibacteria group bacterium]